MKFKDWNDNEHEIPEGKSFLWRPSAYALINEDNKVLLIKSGFHGKWELPGGGVDLGESLEECVVREAFEETGYKIKLMSNIPFYVDSAFFCLPHLDKYYQTIRLVYEAGILEAGREGPIDGDKEVLDVRLIKREDLGRYEFNSLTSSVLKRFFKLPF